MSTSQLEYSRKASKLLSDRTSLLEALQQNDEQLASLGFHVQFGGEGSGRTNGDATPTGRRKPGRPKGSTSKQTPEATATTKKRGKKKAGRKADSQTGTETSGDGLPEIIVNRTGPGRRRADAKYISIDGANLPLTDVIVEIISQVGRPLGMAEITSLVLQSGYQTESDNISQLIHQALARLVKGERLVKDSESESYNVAVQAAA